MLSQTAEQKAELNLSIKHVMETLVPDKIEMHLAQCGDTLERKLGLMKDDLVNEIREQVWKALITWRPDGGANLKTYVKGIIDKRFIVLLKKSRGIKFNFIEHHADVFAGVVEETVTEETAETVFERRHEFMKHLACLGERDRRVLMGLVQGYLVTELIEHTGMSRVEVIRAVNRIDLLIKKRMREDGV